MESRAFWIFPDQMLSQMQSVYLFSRHNMYHIYFTMIRVKVMISPFAKLMSKFLPGFLTASVDFQWISSGNFIFLPDFQLEISQISLSNSRSDLKVKVGQLAFPRSNYLSKLKILTEIRISSVDFQWISSGNFGFLRIFFPRIPAKNLDINFANGDNCRQTVKRLSGIARSDLGFWPITDRHGLSIK